jgi:hypothetical protein
MKLKCSNRGARLQAKAEVAGKTAKCPTCGESIEIPVAPAPSQKKPVPLATERQKEYATELGIDFPPEISRRELSALIDDAVQKQDEEGYERLEELGKRESEAWQQMREAVLKEIDEEDCRLSAAQPQQIVDELGNRNLGAILIWFDIDDIDRLIKSAEGVNFTVSFADIMSETEMRAALNTICSTACFGDADD